MGIRLAVLLLLAGCSSPTSKPQEEWFTKEERISVLTEDLKDVTYEWAMYKEIAIRALMELNEQRGNDATREDIEAHLYKNIRDDKQVKDLLKGGEFERHWVKRYRKSERLYWNPND